MPQISKRFLAKDIEERILEILWSSLVALSNKEDAVLFLDDLLTPTEKLMLAKRIAVVLMLMKGYDYEEINPLLKVSNSTISKIKNDLLKKGAGYKKIIGEIISQEKWEEFFSKISRVLEKLIPPTPGTNWKEVRRKQWEARKRAAKRF